MTYLPHSPRYEGEQAALAAEAESKRGRQRKNYSEQDFKAMRALHAAGTPMAVIADMAGCSPGYVWMVVHGLRGKP